MLAVKQCGPHVGRSFCVTLVAYGRKQYKAHWSNVLCMVILRENTKHKAWNIGPASCFLQEEEVLAPNSHLL